MSQVADPLQNARNAAERYAWREAYEAFSEVETPDLTPHDLERYAESAWWQGRPDEAISLRERS